MEKFNSGLNRAIQIAANIKTFIKANKLQQGDKLPTIAQFASMLNVGKDCVNEAMSMLSYENIVVIRPRHGVFISSESWANLYPTVPNWDQLISKSNLKQESKSRDALNRKIIDSKGTIRSICNPFINSNYCTWLIKRGLSDTSEIISKRDFDTWEMVSMPLREKLCEHMLLYGYSVTPDKVMLMANDVSALSALCMSVLYPRFELLHGSCSYVHGKQRLASHGACMRPLEMDREGITKESLLANLNRTTQQVLYLTPNYSAPTGTTMSKKRREEILRICQNTRTPIIEVDVYRDVSDDLPCPIASMDNSDIVLYIGTISEMLPLGIQQTWVVAPKPVMDILYHHKSQEDFNVAINDAFFYSVLKSGDLYEHKKFYHSFLVKRQLFAERILRKYFNGIAEWNSNGHPCFHWVKVSENANLEKALQSEEFILYGGADFGLNCQRCLLISSLNYTQHSFLKVIKSLSEALRSP